MRAAFAWFELRAHCHATEDEEKVAKVLDFLSPGVRPAKVRAEGFYRNPILVFTARTDSQRLIKGFWRLLDEGGLIPAILDNGGQMIDDEGIIHMRMGKQEAYLGKAALAEGEDVVAVRVKVIKYPSQRGSLLDIAKESIMELTRRHAPH